MSDGDGRLFPSRPSPARNVAWVAFATLVYFGVARLSLSLVFEPEGIAAIWPPEGIFLSAILLSRRGVRPYMVGALLAADFAAEMLAGTPFLVSAIYAAVLAAEAALSAWLLVRFVGEPIGFTKIRELVGFLALAVLLTNCLDSLVAAAASRLVPGTGSFWRSWALWAASDGIGNLIVTPFIMSWAAWKPSGSRDWKPGRVIEGAALFVPLALLNVGVFHYAIHSTFTLLLPYASFPFLLWAALRFGTRGVTSGLLVMAAIAVSLAAGGDAPGHSSDLTPLNAVMEVQIYLVVMAVPSLFLVAVVTERRRAEATLRQSEERFRAIFEQAAVGVALVEAVTGRFVRVNRRFCDIVGRTQEQMAATTFIAITHPEDLAADLEQVEQVKQGRARSYSMEKRYLRPDGTAVWVNLTVSPMWAPGGAPDFFVSVVEDISERRRAQERQEQLQAQLVQAQRIEAVGQLAGGVAHDFNNILTAILMSVGVIQEDPRLSAESHAGLADLEAEARRAANLTRQLLMFSRRQVLQTVNFDLNSLLGNLLKMLRRLIGEQITLEFNGAPGDVWLTADPGMLEQVVMNLVVNARDAMPRGGRVTLTTQCLDVDEGHCAREPEAHPGRFACLSVADTGSGMDEATLQRIFEPFFTTKESGKGTGLGLATVYGIVKQHKGWVEVESTPGRGTVFRVYLPASLEAPVRKVAAAGAKPSRGRGETILLVEDARSVRHATASVLRQLGYRVVEAGNGQEALALWQEEREKVAMLLTDMVMPGDMNGQELVERLRLDRPSLKCLLVSGYSRDLVDQNAPPQQGVTFLAKPLDPVLVAERIRACLDGT